MSRSGFKNIELIKASAIYSKLKKEVTEAGILDRAYGYYAFSFVFTLSGFISSLFAIYYSQSAIFLSLSCISLAIFTVQMAGLMHDGSHRAVFKSALANDVLGYFATSIFGYAYSKWYVTHNMHHASPNRENEDPDMNRPFLAFSEEEAKSKKGISRFLIKYQTLTYLPIISTSALYMQLSGFFYFITDFKLRSILDPII